MRRFSFWSKPERLHVLLNCYAAILPEAIGDMLNEPWCILAALVTQRVFTHFGLRVTPILTNVECLNGVARARRDGSPVPVMSDYPHAIVRCGIGYRHGARLRDNGWKGHLVALVEDSFIVDGAVSQFSKPFDGLDMPDVIVAHAPAIASHRGIHTVLFEGRSGTCSIAYARQPWDRDVERTEYWKDIERAEMIATALRTMMMPRLVGQFAELSGSAA